MDEWNCGDDAEVDEGIRVAVFAPDPITEVGLTAQLHTDNGLVCLGWQDRSDADAIVFSASRVRDQALHLRQLADEVGSPVVLVVDDIEEAELVTAVNYRVVAVLLRAATTGQRLVHGIRTAARGGGVIPQDMVGALLKHLADLQRDVLDPLGHNSAGLTSRELDVLRHIADGLATAEIAEKLCYSERAIKHIIGGVISRLNLRNRPHAVAYAVRAGMI